MRPWRRRGGGRQQFWLLGVVSISGTAERDPNRELTKEQVCKAQSVTVTTGTNEMAMVVTFHLVAMGWMFGNNGVLLTALARSVMLNGPLRSPWKLFETSRRNCCTGSNPWRAQLVRKSAHLFLSVPLPLSTRVASKGTTSLHCTHMYENQR